MGKLHVERGLMSDKCFGGTYSAIVDEWGNEIATTPDDNEHLDIMASAHELLIALQHIHGHLSNGDDCPALCEELARAAIAKAG